MADRGCKAKYLQFARSIASLRLPSALYEKD